MPKTCLIVPLRLQYPLNIPFTTAAERLLRLLDDPVKLRVLGSGRLRELLFTIIDGGLPPFPEMPVE